MFNNPRRGANVTSHTSKKSHEMFSGGKKKQNSVFRAMWFSIPKLSCNPSDKIHLRHQSSQSSQWCTLWGIWGISAIDDKKIKNKIIAQYYNKACFTIFGE